VELTSNTKSQPSILSAEAEGAIHRTKQFDSKRPVLKRFAVRERPPAGPSIDLQLWKRFEVSEKSAEKCEICNAPAVWTERQFTKQQAVSVKSSEPEND
jgi:hypothetical protein